ncbi:MAG: hypothetical protein SOR38_00145 [Oscillospiraceae bacterium]|nr:hypothetical protein [Oscillospiraceae bacterium]MDY3064202.1 hypothetical protein [Oscillospiraceae bacterium]
MRIIPGNDCNDEADVEVKFYLDPKGVRASVESVTPDFEQIVAEMFKDEPIPVRDMDSIVIYVYPDYRGLWEGSIATRPFFASKKGQAMAESVMSTEYGKAILRGVLNKLPNKYKSHDVGISFSPQEARIVKMLNERYILEHGGSDNDEIFE